MPENYLWHSSEQMQRLEPASLGLAYTSYRRIELGEAAFDSAGEELVLVVLQGKADFQCAAQTGQAVFMDMLYVPCQTRIQLQSPAGAALACFGAPSQLPSAFAHLRFADADRDPERHKTYGSRETGCRRDVWHVIDDRFAASRLLAGICRGDPGGWTAWPPHEHARQREEVYAYFAMPDSFGIQCVYEDPAHPLAILLVQDGDLVSVPRGFHPNAGCPAGRICYVYCMTARIPGIRSFMDLSIQPGFGSKLE